MYLFIQLINLFLYLLIVYYLFIYLFSYLVISLSIYLSFYLSIYLFIVNIIVHRCIAMYLYILSISIDIYIYVYIYMRLKNGWPKMFSGLLRWPQKTARLERARAQYRRSKSTRWSNPWSIKTERPPPESPVLQPFFSCEKGIAKMIWTGSRVIGNGFHMRKLHDIQQLSTRKHHTP